MPDHIVELKPRPRGLVTVQLAGGRFFTIPQDEVSLVIGAALSDDEIQRLDRMDQYFRGKEKAVRLISRRARTNLEIKTALDNLSIEASIREGILSELRETGLIDDRRFAYEFVRVKMDVRRLGPHRLRHDLRRLGIRKSIIEEVLDRSFDTETQEIMVRALIARRAGNHRMDERAARRTVDFLRRKGFDYGVINRVVYELLTGAHEHDDVE
jgi:regulatory protein